MNTDRAFQQLQVVTCSDTMGQAKYITYITNRNTVYIKYKVKYNS